MRNKYAIVGTGWTEFSRKSGRSVMSQAVEACKKAVDDSGLKIEDIDGLVTFHHNDSVSPQDLAGALGLPKMGYFVEAGPGGGQICVQLLGMAANAIEAGMAKNVVFYRAMNGRSEHRLGVAGVRNTPSGTDQFLLPYGWANPATAYGLYARRHMIKYGTKYEHFGSFVVTVRKHAAMNPRAQLRKTITLEEYMATPFIVEPYRRDDFCLETDGACAVVITSAERARDLRHRPVYISSVVQGGGPNVSGTTPTSAPRFRWLDHTECFAKYIKDDLFRKADITVNDIDVALLYTQFSYCGIIQLEDFGFCKKGEGGPFIAEGNIALGRKIPVNTNGGQLAEAFFHNLNDVIEAVEQLRGDAGSRQVKDAEFALVTSNSMCVGCAAILQRG